MSIRKIGLASIAALAAALVAASAEAQVTGDAVLQSAVATELGQDAIGSQVKAQKTQAATDDAKLQAVEAGFHGGDRGGDHGRPGPRPGPRPDPRPRPGPIGPRPGRGDWNRWPGHPGWGGDRWEFRDGRWLWWGWTPWFVGAGVACNVYYANSYQACSNAAWASNASCVNACASTGDPACGAACADETRDAVNSCQWSYNSAWNCGVPAVWPPVAIVIRIP